MLGPAPPFIAVCRIESYEVGLIDRNLIVTFVPSFASSFCTVFQIGTSWERQDQTVTVGVLPALAWPVLPELLQPARPIVAAATIAREGRMMRRRRDEDMPMVLLFLSEVVQGGGSWDVTSASRFGSASHLDAAADEVAAELFSYEQEANDGRQADDHQSRQEKLPLGAVLSNE